MADPRTDADRYLRQRFNTDMRRMLIRFRDEKLLDATDKDIDEMASRMADSFWNYKRAPRA